MKTIAILTLTALLAGSSLNAKETKTNSMTGGKLTKQSYLKLTGGSIEVEGMDSEPMFGFSFGGDYINKYATLGADIGLAYSNTKDSSLEDTAVGYFDATIRLGYNFNQDGTGLGVYGVVDSFLGFYSDTQTNAFGDEKTEIQQLSGVGFGVESVYLFEDYVVGVKYTKGSVTYDATDLSSDYTKLNAYVGFVY